jgi:hypothetical protein
MTNGGLVDWQALGRNLRAGFRLVSLRRIRLTDFSIEVGQVFTLVALLFAWALAYGYFTTDPVRSFSTWGMANYCVNYAAFILSLFLVARLQSDYSKTTALLVTQLAAMPALAVFVTLLARGYDTAIMARYQTWANFGILLFYVVWMLIIFVRSLHLVFDLSRARTALLAALYMAINWGVYSVFSDTDLWYSKTSDTWADASEGINIEDTYYAQDTLVERAVDDLLTQRPDKTDLYFVGVAGYAYQDVFLKEVTFARDLFDARFGTRNRSMLLVNNRKTIDALPLANLHNLEQSLNGIAARMDTDQDMLFLFMTSHGSEDHELSVDFYPLEMNDIPADALRNALDASGIKWRIILVSACYSGGFIDALKNDHTLIMTAAARDRTSFGCSDDRDFTYFGEMYLRDQLRTATSFIDAFRAARTAILEREKTEHLDASQPQIYVGTEIKPKLAQFGDSILNYPPPPAGTGN